MDRPGFACWAVAYIGANLPSAQDGAVGGLVTRWLRRRRDQAGFLIGCWAPLLVSATALTTFWCWHLNYLDVGDPYPDWRIFVAVGVALHCIGWLPYLVHQRAPLVRTFRQMGAIFVAGAVGGLLVWWLTRFIPRIGGSHDLARLNVCFATPALLSAMLLAKTLFVGLFSRYSDDDDREWWARAGGWLLIAIVIWSLTSALVLFGPELIAETQGVIAGLGGASGLVTVLLGHSAQTPANLKEKAQLVGKFGRGVHYKNLLLKCERGKQRRRKKP